MRLKKLKRLTRTIKLTKLTKLSYLCIASTMLLGLTGCAKTQEVKEDTKMITIESMNGVKETVNLDVPYDPERIAVLDLASLDILDNLGVGDRVVGVSQTSIPYLASYSDNDKIEYAREIREYSTSPYSSLKLSVKTNSCVPYLEFFKYSLASSPISLSTFKILAYTGIGTL